MFTIWNSVANWRPSDRLWQLNYEEMKLGARCPTLCAAVDTLVRSISRAPASMCLCIYARHTLRGFHLFRCVCARYAYDVVWFFGAFCCCKYRWCDCLHVRGVCACVFSGGFDAKRTNIVANGSLHQTYATRTECVSIWGAEYSTVWNEKSFLSCMNVHVLASERERERLREGEGQTHISANEMIYCFINVRLFWAHFRHRCDERVAPTEPQSTQIKCKFVFQLEELISCRSLPFPFSMQSHNGTITHWIASFGVFNDKNASRDYSFQFSLFDSVRFCFAFVCFAMRRAIISIAFGFRKWQIRMAIRSARTVCVVLHARFCLCQILRSDHCY